MHAILAQMGLLLAPSGSTLSQLNTSCCCPASWSSTQPPLANGVLKVIGRQRNCGPMHQHRCHAARFQLPPHKTAAATQDGGSWSAVCECLLFACPCFSPRFLPPHSQPGPKLFLLSLESSAHSKIFWPHADSHQHPCQDAENEAGCKAI